MTVKPLKISVDCPHPESIVDLGYRRKASIIFKIPDPMHAHILTTAQAALPAIFFPSADLY